MPDNMSWNDIFLLKFYVRDVCKLFRRRLIGMKAVQEGLEPIKEQGDTGKDMAPLEEFVPIGTFAGSQDVILRVRNGRPVAANTGDQGCGQN
jgi:hypothetical protein